MTNYLKQYVCRSCIIEFLCNRKVKIENMESREHGETTRKIMKQKKKKKKAK